MAHFYGTMSGTRGEASRCGTKASGITTHVRGWDVGAIVDLSHENGRDVVRVYRTGGSNYSGRGTLVAEFYDGDEQQATPCRGQHAGACSGGDYDACSKVVQS